MVAREKGKGGIQAIQNSSQRLIESSRPWIKLVLMLDMQLCTLQIKGAELILSFFVMLREKGT